ncbi:hypothetical protein GCK32_019587 [Trichostrongylus colubriformis]|uniref:Uncharacterized protein n=1 Tax=Trichostrongylus colubriformis TaxID=6319 RepID=A0AAN8FR57_TRICO
MLHDIISGALATIAIHDNAKVCVPPEDIDRLRKVGSESNLLDDTYIQKCQCDMNVLKEMAKKIVKEKKPVRSVGRCVVLNGDLTIDRHVEDYLKVIFSTAHRTVNVTRKQIGSLLKTPGDERRKKAVTNSPYEVYTIQEFP